MHWTPF